jgi:putative component of toxin-antitoxin plasmid stabilization module
MVDVIRSSTVDRWLRKLKDRRAAARVLIRTGSPRATLATSNQSEAASASSGIDYGRGYRVYARATG